MKWIDIEDGLPNITDHGRWILIEYEIVPHCDLEYHVLDQQQISLEDDAKLSNNKPLRWLDITPPQDK